jgi:hypothetical protein
MFEYFIVRITNRTDGTFGNSVKAYATEPEALKEFFREAGQAVDTTHLTDSVTMLTKEGFELRHEVFLHDAPAPTPEVAEEPIAE